MKTLAVFLFVGCTSPDSATGIFTVETRMFSSGGACTDPGTSTPPAVPYFQIADNDHGQLAWQWCDSATQCNPIGSYDWFDADGDHWRDAIAFTAIGPDDSGPFCSLGLDTMTIQSGHSRVHVDIERKSASNPPTPCTPDVAIQVLADDMYCSTVDRYDLVPL